MARPTLSSGDIWSAALANASGFPRLDGADEFGSGDKVVDAWLADAPDQIKSRFYGWRDRLAVTNTTGLILSYPGATILLTNGSQVALAAGTITLPANSTRYVFVSNTGTVTHAENLPAECIPLALAVTGASTVTSLSDIRYQVSEHIRQISGGDGNASFDIGDIKTSARLTPSVGWVECDNEIYNNVDYPLAAIALGRQFSLPADPVGTFRVPGIQDRTVIGSSTSRPTGTLLGAEGVSLSVANLARHGHATTESDHTHNTSSGAHSHGVSDPGHRHSVLVGSGGQANITALGQTNSNVPGTDSNLKGYAAQTNNGAGGDIIQRTSTGISVVSAGVNVSVFGARTNLTVNTTGEGQPFSVMQPSIAMKAYIRLF